jgi:DDE superfamily endonuclease
VLLRSDGWSHRQIRLATFANFDFIADALRLDRRRDRAAFAEPQARRPLPPWATILRRWWSVRRGRGGTRRCSRPTSTSCGAASGGRIHVICDNAAFHKSRAVVAYLERWATGSICTSCHATPPETNPIERVWWSLHETLTRNHKCENLDDLLNDVDLWIENQLCFYGPELHPCAIAA